MRLITYSLGNLASFNNQTCAHPKCVLLLGMQQQTHTGRTGCKGSRYANRKKKDTYLATTYFLLLGQCARRPPGTYQLRLVQHLALGFAHLHLHSWKLEKDKQKISPETATAILANTCQHMRARRSCAFFTVRDGEVHRAVLYETHLN